MPSIEAPDSNAVIKVGNTKDLSIHSPLLQMQMSNTRHYTDTALRELVSELTEGQKTMLRVGGALPNEPFGELHLNLRSSDVSKMIEIVEDE